MTAQLSLFDEMDDLEPGRCPHEGPTFETMAGWKTECRLMGKWTNCGEVGHCTAKEGRR
ncbi:MAG: hypothetical protein J6S36_02965 [Eggerthellaceae bacterium]|nr:hypothetical protein [Eggerthellaceae bacterium]